MNCPACNSISKKKSYYPDVLFNGKVFSYLVCNECRMIFLSPLPDKEDFDKMYPPEYQNGLDLVIYSDLKIKLPGLRYDYAYQFDLIERYAAGKSIADYGCGSANFISNAINRGYRCDGAEYNLEFIKILRQNFKNVSFYSIDEFINDKTKYDVIRLSNVLEHLTHPKDILGLLRTKLVDNGILLIEGPIEENFSIAQLFRKCYFILRGIMHPGWKVSHNPTHMFFSNGLNQQRMLEHSDMEQLHFRIKEEAWPFPDKVVFKNGLGGFVKGIIAKVSIMFSVFNSSWGNTFIYVGRKK